MAAALAAVSVVVALEVEALLEVGKKITKLLFLSHIYTYWHTMKIKVLAQFIF